jgi:hypothetical protein
MKAQNQLQQSWDSILRDIEQVLDAEVHVSGDQRKQSESTIQMFSYALPKLAKRVCELAARVGPAFEHTSANIMICHSNEPTSGELSMSLLESSANYGLDNYIAVRDGYWSPFLRTVNYLKPNSKELNKNVIAQALLKNSDLCERIAPETNTKSESEEELLFVHCIIPAFPTNNYLSDISLEDPSV